MNCVERMTVNGTPETLISSFWTTFARKYRLSGERSLPHDREYDVIPDAGTVEIAGSRDKAPFDEIIRTYLRLMVNEFGSRSERATSAGGLSGG